MMRPYTTFSSQFLPYKQENINCIEILETYSERAYSSPPKKHPFFPKGALKIEEF